jgi:hypothetical protein
VNYFFDDKEISEIYAQAELDRGRFFDEQDSFKFTGVSSEFGSGGDTQSESAQGLPCKQAAMEEFMRDSVGRQSTNVKSLQVRKDQKKGSMPILKSKEGMFGKKQTPVVTAPTKGVPNTKSPGPNTGNIKGVPNSKSPGPKTGNISSPIFERLVQVSDRIMPEGLHNKPEKSPYKDISPINNSNDKEARRGNRFTRFTKKSPPLVKNPLPIENSNFERYEENLLPEPENNKCDTPMCNTLPPLSKFSGRGNKEEFSNDLSDGSPAFLG